MSTEPQAPGQVRPYPEPTKTGKAPFKYPKTGLEGETAYYVYGEPSNSNKVPLIGVHGGPGAGHTYLKTLSLLWEDYKIPVVLYDQIGCGGSTHFPDTKGDAKFWTPDLFMDEFENLMSHLNIKKYDFLGQSWGGMLGGQFALQRQPKGLRKLIISDSPSDMKVWVSEANKLREKLPKDVQETLTRCEKEGRTDSKEYEDAVLVFYKRHVCRVDPLPKEFYETMDCLTHAMEVYETMNGPSEFYVVGSLKEWSITGELHKITEETCPGGMLVINGHYDEASDPTTVAFFTQPKCRTKWVRYALSSHMPMLEETERFISDLSFFLLDQ